MSEISLNFLENSQKWILKKFTIFGRVEMIPGLKKLPLYMSKLKFRLDFSFDRLNWTDCHFKFHSSRSKFHFFANLKYLGNLVDSSITRTSSFFKSYNFVTSVKSVMTNVTGPVLQFDTV